MTIARVIVVEDEMIVALDIQSRLKRAGYVVLAIALSGEKAIELAEQMHPDLILMDIGLQGALDGIQAAQKILDHLPTPVVFLTAYNDIKTRQRAEAIPSAVFLVKPFEDRELLGAVQKALGRR